MDLNKLLYEQLSSASTPKSIPEQREKQKPPKKVEPKRVRRAFSHDQVIRLKSEFTKNTYLTGSYRKELAAQLELSDRQVRDWFQNRRFKMNKLSKANKEKTHHKKHIEIPVFQNIYNDKSLSYAQGNQLFQSNDLFPWRGTLLPQLGLTTCISQDQNSNIGYENHFIGPPDFLSEQPLMEGCSTEPEGYASINNPLPDLNKFLTELDGNCPMEPTKFSSIEFPKDCDFENLNHWLGLNWPNINLDNNQPNSIVSDSCSAPNISPNSTTYPFPQSFNSAKLK